VLATEHTQAPLFALVVGIDRYASPLVPSLCGCRNDVEAMSDFLRQRFGAVREAVRNLLDDEASYEAIKRAFREHLIQKPVVASSSGVSTSKGKSASEETIRVRAYQKWESAGKPGGDGVKFWLEAEREVLQAKIV
jgi:hypothetical protein